MVALFNSELLDSIVWKGAKNKHDNVELLWNFVNGRRISRIIGHCSLFYLEDVGMYVSST